MPYLCLQASDGSCDLPPPQPRHLPLLSRLWLPDPRLRAARGGKHRSALQTPACPSALPTQTHTFKGLDTLGEEEKIVSVSSGLVWF